jgi:hypothetical protein
MKKEQNFKGKNTIKKQEGGPGRMEGQMLTGQVKSD